MSDDKVTLPQVAPSDYTNTSKLIHSGPCIVKAVHTSSKNTNQEVCVYDGLNDKGALKARLRPSLYSSDNWRPGGGTDFDYGLYITVSSSDTYVTVTYIPESRKAFI